MYIIGFLHVSLGSSTVQLHDSPVSRCACVCSEAGFSSQNGDRAWVYCWRAVFCCVFLWAKWLCAKDIHKEMFPVYVVKCLSRKVVHSCVVDVSLMTNMRRSGWDNSQKDLYATGFDPLVKRWDKCINVGGYVKKLMFFPGSDIKCFTFYIHLWLIYWLSLVISCWVTTRISRLPYFT
jgi:hypothetical protein